MKGLDKPETAPMPLRSSQWPKGLPEIMSLPPSDDPKDLRNRVINDNNMILIALRQFVAAHRSGRAFGLEHPVRSCVREFPEWIALEALQGVHVIYHNHCMYAPGKFARARRTLPTFPTWSSKCAYDATRTNGATEPGRTYTVDAADP